MKTTELNNIIIKLKVLLKNTKDIKANLCLRILDSNFKLTMVWRTRSKQRQKWGSNLENILISNNVKDEEFFRYFRIIHYDKYLTILTDNNISKIFEISITQGKFKNIEIEPFVEDAYNEEVWSTFVNGELCTSNFLFDNKFYEGIKNKYKEIEGVWKNMEYIFHFEQNGILTHYDLCYFDIENDFKKSIGNWILDKNDLIIQTNSQLFSFQHFNLQLTDKDTIELSDSWNNKINLKRGCGKDIPKNNNPDIIEYDPDINDLF